MRTRIDLHNLLVEQFQKWLTDNNLLTTANVYYQPPENIKMKYPCIIYSLDAERKLHADNIGYKKDYRYSITIIDKDPDSTLPCYIDELQYASFDRHYVGDGLHHYVFTLYY